MNARVMALDALKLAVLQNGCDMIMTGEELRKCEYAIAALEADIAQAGEPVACYAGHRLTPEGTTEFYGYADNKMEPGTMLYTTPPEPSGHTGMSDEVDFSTDRWTFLMDPGYRVSAGQYLITKIPKATKEQS
ncbi:MAG: hypothetical protein WC829_15300 [Hyphomicrobium sp.]|jgi:hypothetical protein